MKVSKLFCALVLAGSLAVIGCGSDDGGSNNNGNGNGGGNADDVCSDCVNDVGRAACVKEYDQCVNIGINVEECPAGARAACDLF
jgi:hypothetical protein